MKLKSFKKAITVVTVLAILMSTAGCVGRSGRSSRRDRDRDDDDDDDRNARTEQSEELECEAEFGTYTIGYGWVEVEGQSAPPDRFTYCAEGNEDSRTPPNNLSVVHDTNFYGPDEGDDFATAILQQLHGQAAQFNGTAYMSEYGTFGENEVYRFDMESDQGDCIQWYVTGDHEYVMFSLMVFDEDEAEEDHSYEVAEEAVYSFVWDR